MKLLRWSSYKGDLEQGSEFPQSGAGMDSPRQAKAGREKSGNKTKVTGDGEGEGEKGAICAMWKHGEGKTGH